MLTEMLPLASVQLDPEFIGVAMILATIGTFGALIGISVTLIHAVKSIWLARISRSLISELLSKGYSLQEVTDLIHGDSRTGSRFKWMSFAKSGELPARNQPVPPVKNRVF